MGMWLLPMPVILRGTGSLSGGGISRMAPMSWPDMFICAGAEAAQRRIVQRNRRKVRRQGLDAGSAGLACGMRLPWWHGFDGIPKRAFSTAYEPGYFAVYAREGAGGKG